MLTVFGFDPTLDGGVRIGGDTIRICSSDGGRRAATRCRAAGARRAEQPAGGLRRHLARTASGTAAIPYDALGNEFGHKPFDPFTDLPDDENEDDEWVFPLANPYDLCRQRRDRRQPACSPGSPPAATCRRVGFTAYGGAGDDTDHRQPGGRSPGRRIGRRHDPRPARRRSHLRRLRREREHPHPGLDDRHRRSRPEPTIDDGRQTTGTTIDPYPSPVRDDLTRGRDVIDGAGPGTAGRRGEQHGHHLRRPRRDRART